MKNIDIKMVETLIGKGYSDIIYREKWIGEYQNQINELRGQIEIWQGIKDLLKKKK